MRNPAPLERWQSEVIGPLRHLMTFACDRVNEVSRLSVLSGHDRIEVVYEKAALAHPARPAHPTEFPLSAASLGSGLEDVVARWFQISADIGPILGLFLGQRYRPGTFVENHFLNTVTAAEAYHRARHSNEVLDPSEFQARQGAVVEAAPARYKDWLKGALEYSNEPPLSQRLEVLCDSVASLGPVTGTLAPFGRFTKSVARARNDLAHRTGRGKKTTGADFYRMTQQTSQLLSACLLTELQLPAKSAEEALERTRAYRFLKRQW